MMPGDCGQPHAVASTTWLPPPSECSTLRQRHIVCRKIDD
jgi:hypothetical protein